MYVATTSYHTYVVCIIYEQGEFIIWWHIVDLQTVAS